MAQRYATVAEVRAVLGPGFDDPVVTDAQIQSAIDDQVCFIGLAWWGTCASVASKYAAAHCIALSPAGQQAQGGGQAGLESGNANGPASRSWAISPASADDSWWASTWWGLKFLELRKAKRGTGVLILGATARTARPS